MPLPIEWPGATYGSGTGTQYTSPNGDTWVWSGYAWEGLIATATPSLSTIYNKELISGGAIWNSGMTFDVSALTYSFYGPIQSTGATSVTLSIGDAAYDRIDAIVVNDDDPSGLVYVKGGTAGPNPATPEIEVDELLVQYIIVPTGATSLTPSQEIIYNENLEWTGTVIDSGGTGLFDFASTTPTPFGGSSVCLYVTGNNRRRRARFTRSGGSISSGDYALLSFKVYFPNTISTSRTLNVQFRNGATFVGNSVPITPTFASRTVTGTWQNVIVPLYLFNLTGNIDSIDFVLSGTNNTNLADWAIDLAQLQNGIPPSLGNQSPYRPWGIYTQNTGVLNTYSTLAQAISAAQLDDTIHLFCDVSESGNGNFQLQKDIDFNFNGNTLTYSITPGENYLFYNETLASRTIFRDGKISFGGGSGNIIIGLGVGSDGSSLQFIDFELENTNGGMCVSIKSDYCFLSGGKFTTSSNTAVYVSSSMKQLENIKCRNNSESMPALDIGSGASLDGPWYTYRNLEGINSSYSSTGPSGAIGVYIRTHANTIEGIIGESYADGGIGIYIRGNKGYLRNVKAIAYGGDGFFTSYGLYVESAIGPIYDSWFKANGESKSFAIYANRISDIHNSYILGQNGIYTEEFADLYDCTIESTLYGVHSESRILVVNSSIRASYPVAATGATFYYMGLIDNEIVATGTESAIWSAPTFLDGSSSLITQNQIIGATSGYAIDINLLAGYTLGATSAYANNIINGFTGPANPVNVFQRITSTPDSQGNITI
jgi:hypothetical protein